MAEAKNTARDFFLYLFATIALYVSAINVIALLWQYVNYFFPEPLSGRYYGGFSSSMRFAISALIILFPAFVFVMRFLNRDIDRHPEKRELWIRRWLIYLTLFIAAAVIIGDLISLLNTFLGGDLAIRFFLKALSVLLVAGVVFWYYLFNLKRKPGEAALTRNLLVWISLGALVALIIGAFFIVGSPTTNRLRNHDLTRVSDLQSIQNEIVYTYWQQKRVLPTQLSDLEDPITGFVTPKDPVTGEAYEYRSTGELSFELCATFALKSDERALGVNGKFIRPMGPYEYETPTYWQHEAGKACFTRTIDPELFKEKVPLEPDAVNAVPVR